VPLSLLRYVIEILTPPAARGALVVDVLTTADQPLEDPPSPCGRADRA
jgi:hypothetical protein